MKKNKKLPEQKIDGPTKIGKAALIDAMRRLKANADYRVLLGRWLDLRGRILEDGKAKPSEAAWSILAGFDMAILEPEKWAAMQTEHDILKQRAEELQAQMTGGN